MNKNLTLALLLLLVTGSGCQQLPLPVSQPVATAQPASPLSTFLLKAREHFGIKQAFSTQEISAEHSELLTAAVTEFVEDMAQSRTESYFQQPDFSIQLLAGSEGSYFQSSEQLLGLHSQIATYAMALVVDADGYNALFKGQVIDGKFFFSGSDGLPENNSTYLITLDNELAPQVFSGSLQAFSVQAEATPSPVTSPTSTPSASVTPSPTPSAPSRPSPKPLPLLNPPPGPPPAQAYRDALQRAEQQRPGYRSLVGRFQPFPPPPPPPNYRDNGHFMPPPGPPGAPPPPGGGPVTVYPSEAEMARIRRERPQLEAELKAIRGLPPEAHRMRLAEIYAANQDLLSPPPEGPIQHPEETR